MVRSADRRRTAGVEVEAAVVRTSQFERRAVMEPQAAVVCAGECHGRAGYNVDASVMTRRERTVAVDDDWRYLDSVDNVAGVFAVHHLDLPLGAEGQAPFANRLRPFRVHIVAGELAPPRRLD